MDFQRLLLVIALSIILLMLYQSWQQEVVAPAAQPAATSGGQDLPPATPRDMPAPTGSDTLSSAGRVRVVTDVYAAEIDTQGGDVRRIDLLRYPVEAARPQEPFRLLDDGAELFVAQSGLRPAAGESRAAPDHYALYHAEQEEYRMAPDQQELVVRLRWQGEDGLAVDKVYTFRRGSYVVELSHEVHNASTTPWAGHGYHQLQRSRPANGPSAFGVYTYTGGVIYSQEEKYEKIDFDAMDERALTRAIQGGWAAMIQHYFLGAWIPAAEQTHDYYSKALGNGRYLLGMMSPSLTVAPGETGAVQARMYVGPKLQDQLGAVAPGLELTVDYGKLTFLAEPIFWLLEQIHKLVNNWGWAIIILTILIKLAFFHLSATSYKSMAQMRKLQPRLQALKERFGDDRQKMNEAMMKMYREEKINPLGGCLPILVQIPVFIALYWVLLESVELRQAPWILWITDMSSKDPYFILPIIMGASMLIQHRLNPTPMDPIQAKVMMALPLVFTVFFAFFPSGLVLYWVVNNVLSITQQWYITRWVVKA